MRTREESEAGSGILEARRVSRKIGVGIHARGGYH